MKIRKIAALLLAAVVLCLLASCAPQEPEIEQTGQIFLYGEIHGCEILYEKEFELWSKCYHERGMRHLFEESSYFMAEFFNLWMQSDNDDILYQELGWTGKRTALVEFYMKIKEECPETVFHGTDVGQRYDTIGTRYLEYLESVGQEDSEQYRLAQENIQQGQRYDVDEDEAYRENMMAENFIREMDSLDGADVMGIYGADHTELDAMDYMTGTVPTMAAQLQERYGEKVHSEYLPDLVTEPIRTETIEMGGKVYTAQYFGTQITPNTPGYEYVEYWRLEDAFEDARRMGLTFSYLAYDLYPMKVEDGQVFLVEWTGSDGSKLRAFFRANGFVVKNKVVTESFDPDK